MAFWSCGENPAPEPGTVPWPWTRRESIGRWHCIPGTCPANACDSSAGDQGCCEQNVGANSIDITTGEVSFKSRLVDAQSTVGTDVLRFQRSYSSGLEARHLAEELTFSGRYWALVSKGEGPQNIGITLDNRIIYDGIGEMGTYHPHPSDVSQSVISLEYGAELTVAQAESAGYIFDFAAQQYRPLKLGMGWTHNFSHLLSINDTGQVVYTRPNASREFFEPVMGQVIHSSVHPAIRLDLRHLESPTIILPNGDRVVFQSASVDLDQPPVVPVRIVEAAGREILFRYWRRAEHASVPYCAISDSSRIPGELCELVSSQGAALYFAAYDGPDGQLTEVRSGYRSDADTANFKTLYGYESSLRVTHSGEPITTNPIHPALPSEASVEHHLVGVSQWEHNSQSWNEVNGEFYDYASDTYSALEWGESVEPISGKILRSGISEEPIVASILKSVRDYAGGIIQGHQYAENGFPVTDETPGRLLQIDWSQFGLEEGRKVSVTDRSGGTPAVFSLNEMGELVAQSDDCGCSLDTALMERDEDGRITAKRTRPVSELHAGVRTTYQHDEQGRVVLQQTNWDGPAHEFSTTSETRIREIEYLGDTSLVTLEREWHSVLCDNAGLFGLSCGAEGGPGYVRETVTDYDSDYDTEYNATAADDNGGLHPRQSIRSGYTLRDVATGQIEKVDLVQERYYEPDTGNVTTEVSPGGAVTTLLYYDSNEGTANAGRLREKRLNGESLALFGDYDLEGRPGWVEQLGRGRVVSSYSPTGQIETRVTHSEDGDASESLVQFEYLKDGRVWSKTQRSPGVNVALKTIYHYFGEVTREEIGPEACLDGPSERDLGFYDNLISESLVEHAGKQNRVHRTIRCLIDLQNPVTPELLSVVQAEYDARGNRVLSQTSNAAGDVLLKKRLEFSSDNDATRIFKYTDDDISPSFVREQAFERGGYLAKVSNENFSDVVLSHNENLDIPSTRQEFDRFGRLHRRVRAPGALEESSEVRTFDLDGNLVGLEDGNGNTTRYLYDDFGRLVVRRSPDTGETRYSYTPTGELEFMRTDDGMIRNYSYDARGRVLSEVFDYAGGGSTLDNFYRYDEAALADLPFAEGNYHCGDSQIEFFLENIAGRLAWVEHGAGYTFYSYDGHGRQRAVYEALRGEDPCDMAVRRFEHDGLGRRIQETLPSGKTVAYQYETGDGTPQLKPFSVLVDGVQVVTNMRYDAATRLKSYESGFRAYEAMWDLAGQLKARNYEGASAGTGVEWNVIERDGLGNPRHYGDLAQGKTMSVTYDGRSRVETVQGERMRGYQSCSYEYDAASNRRAEVCYGHRQEYGYGSDISNGQESVSWESDDLDSCFEPGTDTVLRSRESAPAQLGQITKIEPHRFSVQNETIELHYDISGRLESSSNENVETNYSYDHRGLRTSKSSDELSTRFVHDARGQLVYESQNGMVTEYVWGPGGPLLAITGTGSQEPRIHVIGIDHLGTPIRAWSTETGDSTWAADHEVFGKATAYLPHEQSSPAIDISLRYPGQYFDAETGLHYNRWRYYSPTMGRYTRPDPLGERRAGTGGYSYAGNGPGRFIDPSGLAFFMKRPLASGGPDWLHSLLADAISGGGFEEDNLEATHENLFYTDGLSSIDKPGNVGFFAEGGVRPDLQPLANGSSPGPTYLPETRDGEYNDCVMRRAQSLVVAKPYSLFGPKQYNCQDYADALRGEYRRLRQSPTVSQECGCD